MHSIVTSRIQEAAHKIPMKAPPRAQRVTARVAGPVKAGGGSRSSALVAGMEWSVVSSVVPLVVTPAPGNSAITVSVVTGV